MHSVRPTVPPSPASSTDSTVLLPVLARLGFPVFLFGVVFFALSLVLTALLSPDRFPVRIGDAVVRLSELQQQEASLRMRQADLLEQRERFLQNAEAPVLAQLGKVRKDFGSVGPVLLEIEKIRRSFVVGDIDPIRLPVVTYDAAAHTLTIGGDVTDPSSRSLSILSAFVDALRKIPILQSDSGRTPVSDPPEYAQKPSPNGGTVSAFTIVITLP